MKITPTATGFRIETTEPENVVLEDLVIERMERIGDKFIVLVQMYRKTIWQKVVGWLRK